MLGNNHDLGERTFRHAAGYTATVLGAALTVVLVSVVWMWVRRGDCPGSLLECAGAEKYVLVFVPPTLLAIGGVGAFVQTIRTWRGGGRWAIWQGAGWLLFVFMLIFVSLSAGSLIQG
ncbi:hypothetical protein [Rhodococcus sp. NPDC049939]|uniref:hypothetical protein n=1 Tax=Rhodococcus sp. NPDC049939 TaxID=3155511 RepID=UPI0033FBD6EF